MITSKLSTNKENNPKIAFLLRYYYIINKNQPYSNKNNNK